MNTHSKFEIVLDLKSRHYSLFLPHYSLFLPRVFLLWWSPFGFLNVISYFNHSVNILPDTTAKISLKHFPRGIYSAISRTVVQRVPVRAKICLYNTCRDWKRWEEFYNCLPGLWISYTSLSVKISRSCLALCLPFHYRCGCFIELESFQQNSYRFTMLYNFWRRCSF